MYRRLGVCLVVRQHPNREIDFDCACVCVACVRACEAACAGCLRCGWVWPGGKTRAAAAAVRALVAVAKPLPCFMLVS